MKKLLIIIAILSAGSFLISFDKVAHHSPIHHTTADSLADARLTAITAIMDSLKGKETMSADSVFTNITLFKGSQRVQVRHLMGIMNYWGEALGVTCGYCHTTSDWPSDKLKTKRIARDMYLMRQTINSEILSKISDLDPKLAKVNCTTCHNGKVTPRK